MAAPLPEALVRWLNSVPEGTCPGCKQPLLPGQRRGRGGVSRLCTRPKCPGRQEYVRLYSSGTNQRLRGPSFLREVVRVEDVKDKPRRVRIVLSCSHSLEQPRSKGATGQKKRQCQECRKEATAQAAPAA